MPEQKGNAISTGISVAGIILFVIGLLLAYRLVSHAGSSKTDLMIGVSAGEAILGVIGLIASIIFVQPAWKKLIISGIYIISAILGAGLAILGLTIVGG